jgi:hypothetical protein
MTDQKTHVTEPTTHVIRQPLGDTLTTFDDELESKRLRDFSFELLFQTLQTKLTNTVTDRKVNDLQYRASIPLSDLSIAGRWLCRHAKNQVVRGRLESWLQENKISAIGHYLNHPQNARIDFTWGPEIEQGVAFQIDSPYGWDFTTEETNHAAHGRLVVATPYRHLTRTYRQEEEVTVDPFGAIE